MTIKRENNKLVISIPENVLDITEIQELLDYLKFKTITSKSKATQKDIDEIAEDIDSSWWVKNRKRFVK